MTKKIQVTEVMHNSKFSSVLLKGAMKVNDDLLSPVVNIEEWEVSIKRTAQQIEGCETAFKASKKST